MLKLNVGQTGFYRVQYEEGHLARLGQHMMSLHASDRIGVTSDAFALSMAGRVPLVECMQLVHGFAADDDEYLVWGEVASRLGDVLSTWWEEPKEVRSALDTFIHGLTGNLASQLTFDPAQNDSDKRALLRPLILGLAGRSGNQKVIAEAKRRFAQFRSLTSRDADSKQASSILHPNLRATTYGIVMREGGRAEYDALLDIYETQPVMDQRLAALGALGAARDPSILTDALNLTLKTSPIRSQDIMYVFGAVARNPVGRRLAWDHLRTNWSVYYDRYYRSSFALLSRLVSSTTENFTTLKDASEVEAFFHSKNNNNKPDNSQDSPSNNNSSSLAGIDRAIKQSVERIKMNAAWLTRNRESLARWLTTKLF